MSYGGARPGAGRPKGSKNKATLEKTAIVEAFNQRVMSHADNLFNAQYKLAVGAQQVFRIAETKGEKGAIKREHVLVTDPDEIKALLDEHDGDSGQVNDNYYYFTTVLPDNRALDSLLNRTFGKAKEAIEHTGKDGGPILFDSPEQMLQRYMDDAEKSGKPITYATAKAELEWAGVDFTSPEIQ